MWARAHGLSDAELVDFDVEKDLVQVRSGSTSYGTIIFGKIKIPAIKEGGEGYVHARFANIVATLLTAVRMANSDSIYAKDPRSSQPSASIATPYERSAFASLLTRMIGRE